MKNEMSMGELLKSNANKNKVVENHTQLMSD